MKKYESSEILPVRKQSDKYTRKAVTFMNMKAVGFRKYQTAVEILTF